MKPEQKLAELGISLPTPPAPVAAYIPSRRSGTLLFVSGQIPFRDGALIATGVVPSQVSPEVARDCARQCCVNGLAVVRQAAGSLDKVRAVLRLGVFVACEREFHQHPQVANAASELLVSIFGEAGRHARAAVGAPSLPLNAPVEIEMLVELEA